MKSYKLVFTVPESHADIVREALALAWAWIIGNYSHCSFSSKGVGRFLPLEGANPFIGTSGKAEEVIEERVEMVVAEDKIHLAIARMKQIHPYEEVAYDVLERLDF